MTGKQQALVRAVAEGNTTVAEAARIAGYGHRETASKMLRNPTVAEAIEVARVKKLEKAKDFVAFGDKLLRKAVADLHSGDRPPEIVAEIAMRLRKHGWEELDRQGATAEADPRAELAHEAHTLQAVLVGTYLTLRSIRGCAIPPAAAAHLEQRIQTWRARLLTLRVLLGVRGRAAQSTAP